MSFKILDFIVNNWYDSYDYHIAITSNCLVFHIRDAAQSGYRLKQVIICGDKDYGKWDRMWLLAYYRRLFLNAQLKHINKIQQWLSAIVSVNFNNL